MHTVEERLSSLGLELPTPFTGGPGTTMRFEAVHVAGGLAYVSGHGPTAGQDTLMRGKVGTEISTEQGYEAARLTALAILASLASQLGDLERVVGWVKVLGFVNCAPGYNETPAVINGFSDLILTLWGDAGRHARSAIGVAELPFDMPVEIEAIVRVEA